MKTPLIVFAVVVVVVRCKGRRSGDKVHIVIVVVAAVTVRPV
jgi:hypothetical protein